MPQTKPYNSFKPGKVAREAKRAAELAKEKK
jgi:hypothetical protein